MSTSIQHESQVTDVICDAKPRPALAEAFRDIALITRDDDTVVISDWSIEFANAGERTTISAVPVKIDTWDGRRIEEIVTIRTTLNRFKLFNDNEYSVINLFATTGAVVRDTNGEHVIISRLPLFADEDAVLPAFLTPLIADAARLHTVGIYCGFYGRFGRKDEYTAELLSLPLWDQPSYWRGPDFEDAEEWLRSGGLYANAGEEGLTVEFPWVHGATSAVLGDTTSLLTLQADVAHPAAGNGIFFRLQLPLDFTAEEAKEWAVRLNQAEIKAVDTPPFFGAWCAHPDARTVSFVGFWPNLLYKPKSAAWIAAWCYARSRFARSVIGNWK